MRIFSQLLASIFQAPKSAGTSGLTFEAYQADPVGRFLIGRVRISPVGAVLVGLAVMALTEFIAFAIYSFWEGGAHRADFTAWVFGQWSNVALFWVVFPVAIGFYPWVMRAAGQLYERLYRDRVLIQDRNAISDLLLKGDRSISRIVVDRRAPVIAALLAILATAWPFVQGLGSDGLWQAQPGMGTDIWIFQAVGVPAYMLALYMVFMTVAMYLATLRGLSKLFEATVPRTNESVIRLRPWHPDRCGGLRAISQYAVRISWYLAALGLIILLNIYNTVVLLSAESSELSFDIAMLGKDLILIAFVAAYIVLAPIVFFMTLSTAHREMKKAKTERFEELAQQFDRAYDDVQSHLGKAEPVPSETVDDIEQIQKLYDFTRGFPVWPMNWDIMRRFMTAYLIPVVSFAAVLGAQFVIGLLGD